MCVAILRRKNVTFSPDGSALFAGGFIKVNWGGFCFEQQVAAALGKHCQNYHNRNHQKTIRNYLETITKLSEIIRKLSELSEKYQKTNRKLSELSENYQNWLSEEKSTRKSSNFAEHFFELQFVCDDCQILGNT